MAFFPDLIFALYKVIIKLVDELLALVQSHNVPLSTIVTLFFDQFAAFFRRDHDHLESLPVDFCFVHLTGLLLSCEDRSRRLFLIFKRLKLLLAYQLSTLLILAYHPKSSVDHSRSKLAP